MGEKNQGEKSKGEGRYPTRQVDDSFKWFGVRSIFEWTNHREADLRAYEERIVSVWADSLDSAIELAEVEAADYCSGGSIGFEHLGLYQGYVMSAPDNFDYSGPLEPFVELFSQLRWSSLEPEDYLNRFFDTGQENNRNIS